MKINICQNCGLTMSAGVQSCRRCKHKSLASHDIMCQDDYVINKRVNQLASEHDRTPALPSQMMSAMVVLAVTSLGLMGYDYYAHPDGMVAKQAKSVLSLLPTSGNASIARAKTGNSL